MPERLYYEGDIGLINNLKNIAVVGTRRMSEYGRVV
ncbi:DNA-protecting protein DprA, partial [Candidatus Collierbacteria bacterium CG17_big_fil_post_rev_8_21_14_2_50_45_7]